MSSADRKTLAAGRSESRVGRVDAVLRALERAAVDDSAPRRLTQLAADAGLPLTTAHRLVAELVATGFVAERDSGYELGSRLFELGELVGRKRHLRDAALPFMEDLYEVTHETIQLAVLDGTDVLYIDKIGGHRQVRAPSRVGGRVPATCTGLGKAILSRSPAAVIDTVLAAPLPRRTRYSIVDAAVLRRALDEARRDGYALDREEAALGLSCVAVPVIVGGAAVAALSVSMPSQRLQPAAVAPAVRTAAVSLARVLTP